MTRKRKEEPIDFGRLFDKARPHPNQREMAKVIAEDFPLDNHTGYTFGKKSAGDIIRKLFEEKEEEIEKNDVRQAPRKNLKCRCLLEFSEKRHRK